MSFPQAAAWLVIAGTCGVAFAQQSPVAAPATATYRSAFEDYRPFADETATPWRETNDTVGRIGGWKAYARQAREAAAAPAPAASGSAPARSGEHPH
jgi:hypothetical protein